MNVRRRFHLAFAGLFVFLVAVWGLALTGVRLPSHVPTHETPAIPESDWGHVQAYDGAFLFTLAPSTDQRRKYELGFGRVVFTSGGVIVADDTHMKNAVVLQGEPKADCLYQWQGSGVNILVAIGKCVPGWAEVTGDPNHGHARQWIRVESLRPNPSVVVLRYR